MPTFEKSIRIAASPQEVWSYLVHPHWIQKWWTALREYHYASELQSGLGMKFVVEEKIGMGPPLRIEFEVTRWMKPEQIKFKMVSGTGAKSYEISWTLELVEGGTLFNYVETLTLSTGFMDKVWGKLGRRSGMEHIDRYLRNLKMLAESRAAEAAHRQVA
ncbi:MAG TPA: SRPBCC family protein [Anaerolineales bacterium]|nr:SRPBCC family protein [Anaerolineales bacterium]